MAEYILGNDHMSEGYRRFHQIWTRINNLENSSAVQTVLSATPQLVDYETATLLPYAGVRYTTNAGCSRLTPVKYVGCLVGSDKIIEILGTHEVLHQPDDSTKDQLFLLSALSRGTSDISPLL